MNILDYRSYPPKVRKLQRKLDFLEDALVNAQNFTQKSAILLEIFSVKSEITREITEILANDR